MDDLQWFECFHCWFEYFDQFEWIISSIANLPFRSLSIDIDNDLESFFEYDKIISIRLCSNQSCWDYDESCSIGNIDDHARRRARSSTQSWSLFRRWRWRTIQCRGKSFVSLLRWMNVCRIGLTIIIVESPGCRIFPIFKVYWFPWMIRVFPTLEILRVWTIEQVEKSNWSKSNSNWL